MTEDNIHATDEQIHAGARAMCTYNGLRQLQHVDYDTIDRQEREHWEDLARVCITVAIARPPQSHKECE